jgi:hypothetical protein
VVHTDSDSANGVAPICADPAHPADQPNDVCDCCTTQRHYEAMNEHDAADLVLLLNGLCDERDTARSQALKLVDERDDALATADDHWRMYIDAREARAGVRLELAEVQRTLDAANQQIVTLTRTTAVAVAARVEASAARHRQDPVVIAAEALVDGTRADLTVTWDLWRGVVDAVDVYRCNDAPPGPPVVDSFAGVADGVEQTPARPVNDPLRVVTLAIADQFAGGRTNSGVWVAFIAGDGLTSIRGADATEIAPVALDALAAAGYVLIPTAGMVEQWGIRVDEAHPQRSEAVGTVMTHLGEEKSRRCRDIWPGWTPVRRTVSGWEEIPDDGT